jgi:transcriptional regulator with XRE-family HTH domain
MTLRLNRNKLLQIRRAKGLSAIDLQVLTGIPYSKIYYIERGTHKPKDREKDSISKALGCPIETVFPNGLEDNEEIVAD